MHVDDLVLVANSPEELQAMLNIVHTYAGKWRYNLNAGKSFVMVFGESPHSRTQARSSWKWYLGSEEVEEADKVHHLGILRSVSFSTISCTTEWSTARRREFLALNTVGSSLDVYTLLHHIDSTLCLPVTLYGSGPCTSC